MKTLTTALLFLLSLSSFAASEHYFAKYENADGSITIHVPEFGDTDYSDTETNFVANTSDLDGVCLLYGYDSYVSKSVITMTENRRTTLINSLGKFGGYTTKTNAIGFISCRNKNTEVPSSTLSAVKKLNDDGSTTFIEPVFKMNNEQHPVHISTSPQSICLSLGMSRYVDGSILLSDTFRTIWDPSPIQLNESRAFESNVRQTKPYTNQTVKSLICE